MSSRGQILVKIALQKKVAAAMDHEVQYIIQGSNIDIITDDRSTKISETSNNVAPCSSSQNIEIHTSANSNEVITNLHNNVVPSSSSQNIGKPPSSKPTEVIAEIHNNVVPSTCSRKGLIHTSSKPIKINAEINNNVIPSTNSKDIELSTTSNPIEVIAEIHNNVVPSTTSKDIELSNSSNPIEVIAEIHNNVVLSTTSTNIGLPTVSKSNKIDLKQRDVDDSIDIDIELDDDDRDPTYIPVETDSDDTDEQNDEQEHIHPIHNVDHEETIQNENATPKHKRKNKSNSCRAKNKKLRMEGKSYKGMKKTDDGWKFCSERNGRLLCEYKCSKRCDKSKIRQCRELTEETRRDIFDQFWGNMDWEQRKVYVNGLVESGRTATKSVEDSRRQKSFRYSLLMKDRRLPVCKGMFLATLGIGEKTVYGWCADASNGVPKQTKEGARRLEQERRHDETRQGIVRFLEELPKLTSHYCRSTSTKLYLEPIFDDMASVHKEYQNYCTTHGINTAQRTRFNQVFNEMNLSIFKPKKDQCDMCCGFEAGNVSREDYNIHIRRKTVAREEKNRDKARAEEDPSLKVFTMDLQSVLLCPKLNASALYYKTKLTCHNFTIMDIVTKQVKCYFCNESHGDLSANSFASCIADYIENLITQDRAVKHIILFSDGCTYQNRNCVLSNALCHLCRKFNVEITQKYLERGHTQMEIDSAHSVIEKKVKKKNIYIPQNYVDTITQACQLHPYQVQYVDFTFFKNFMDLSYYSGIRPGTKVGDPVVTDIRVLNYTPMGDIRVKLMFEEEFNELPRRARITDVLLNDPPQLHGGQLPIKKSKFQHLQQLKSVIPPDYHAFFDSLPHD